MVEVVATAAIEVATTVVVAVTVVMVAKATIMVVVLAKIAKNMGFLFLKIIKVTNSCFHLLK